MIDPKGVIGPAGYEVGPLLMNPWGDLLNGNNYRLMTKRRIDILHEHWDSSASASVNGDWRTRSFRHGGASKINGLRRIRAEFCRAMIADIPSALHDAKST